MGIIRRFAGSFTGATDLQHPALWLKEWALGRRTASGEFVNPTTSFGLPAYYACVRNVSEDVAKCKPEVRRRRLTGRGGSDGAVDHPAYRLLYGRWSPGLSQIDGTATLMHYALAWGNGCAEIERNPRGDPVALHPIHPGYITEFDTTTVPGSVVYVWQHPTTGQTIRLDEGDVFHIRGLGDGPVGYSVANFHAESVGRGLAAQRAGAGFFGENMTPRMIASVEGVMDADQRKAFRKQIGVDRESDPVGFRKLPIIPHPVKFERWGIPPKDAQYIETEHFSVEEIQRWFRMPGSKIQNARRAQGWSTLDAEQSDYVTDCLLSWFIRIEQEAEAKLLSEEDRAQGVYVRCKVQALLRGDTTTRNENYTKRFMMATLSPNDIRGLEDENPIDEPWADKYYLQGAMITGEDAGGGEEPEAEEAEEQEEGDEQPVEEDEEAEADDAFARLDRAAEVAWPAFVDAARRIVRKERGALASAARRYASNETRFLSWAEKFYSGLDGEAAEAFGPALDVLVRATGRAWSGRRGVPVRAAAPLDLRAHLERDEDELAEEMAHEVRGACVAAMKEEIHAAASV